MDQSKFADSGVTVTRNGGIAEWTINRPDRMNALGRSTVRHLGALAREATLDPTLRVIILRGEGGKAFCAGADLKERQSMDKEDVRDFLGLYRSAFDSIDRLPMPIIAAIDGVAFGGGLELALACDLRIASSSSQIGLTEVSLAIIPGAGGTQRITRLVGPAKAKELILFAKRLTASEALALSIVNEVAENASVRARELAQQLESSAPIAVRAALHAIDVASDLPLDAGLLEERRAYELTLESEDRLEALAAFKDKRKPVYRGV